MVDARDLKSLGALHRAGSIPALGTKIKVLGIPSFFYNIIINNIITKIFYCKIMIKAKTMPNYKSF